MAFSITSRTKENSLCIEEAPTAVTLCVKCKYLIEKEDVRVTFYRNQRTSIYYHLDCFQPFMQVRIDLEEDIYSIVKRPKAPSTQERITQWVASWNRQFLLSQSDISSICHKFIPTNQPANKRTLLEAFKFLEPAFLGRTVTLVSKDWYHVSWDEELWKVASRLQAETKPQYVQNVMNTCIHCHALLPPSSRFMICPLYHRPKCRQCYSKSKYRPYRLTWVFTEQKLTRSYLLSLGARFFPFSGHECCYMYQIKPLIQTHRRKVVQILLDSDCEGRLEQLKPFLEALTDKDLVNLRFYRVFHKDLAVRKLAEQVSNIVKKAKTAKQCLKFLKSLNGTKIPA